MEQRVQHKLLTQIVNNLQSSPKASLWFAANVGKAVNSHITWYANLYHSTSDSVYVSSVCKSFPMQWVLQFNGQIIVTWTVVGRTLRVKKHFPPPTPDPWNPVCLANSFIGQCQFSSMHCLVMPMDKKYTLWCMSTADTLPLLNTSTHLATVQHYRAE